MDLASLDLLQMAVFAGVLLTTGAIAGICAGLLGVGGGIVIVPILYTIFPFFNIDPALQMHLAVGTSLATIIPTSIVSARSHHGRGSLDMDLLKSWFPAIVIGVLIGTYLGGRASGATLSLIFGIIGLLVSLNMVFKKEGMVLKDVLPTGPVKQGIGMFIGGFSVVMGIGGGTLSVPILSAFNYPIRKAVGTASAIGLVIAVPGTLGFIWAGLDAQNLPVGSLGYVNLIAVALIIPTTMLMAPVGAKIAHTISTRQLKWAFALFLGITATRMLYSTFSGV